MSRSRIKKYILAKHTENIFLSSIHAAQHHSEGKSMVIVRVPKHDEISLTTALDAGAAGIVIPHCESAEDVRRMIREAYYRKLIYHTETGRNNNIV
jgi:2-keto-3-deoxy-L-rhamnonate aldolase RhmA